MVTLRDVAKEAGVSTATASRVLQGVGYRHAETINRVMVAAKKLNYIADTTAQHLRKGQSNVVGVIVSDINNQFYNITLSHVESRLKQQGYTMLLTYSFEDPAEERDSFTTLIASKVSTILFTPVTDQNRDILDQAARNGIQVVQLYRQVYEDIDALVFDDEQGAYLGTRHLLEQGCRRPLLLSVEYEHISKGTAVLPIREHGYRRALREWGITWEHVALYKLTKSNSASMQELLEKVRPDAVLAGTNTLAMDLLQAMKTLSLRFPEDIKLIAFDDMDWVVYLEITAIHQPIHTFADLIVSRILRESREECVLDLIPSALLVRRSTQG